ncbi:putative signal transducing protein [Flavobacterium flavipallidum]|uniref:DUF2007 domain-containing protein n=1 Tax=Flavobacterium flavipallidum TaxID=3139140 RepID=A0ABU9HKG5_9FLAO
MEETKFQEIANYQYSSEALIFKGKLESEGVVVYLKDINIIDANPLYSNAVGGVKLLVSKEDYVKAMEIISQISEYSLDNENTLMKCPNCGAEQINMRTSISDYKSLLVYIFSVIIGFIPFYSKHKYKCNSCNFEFN